MVARSFIDTNVLIYAEAGDTPRKQQAALAMLKRLFAEAQGVLSTQVLQEYCNVALKKLQLPAQHVRAQHVRAQLDVYEQFEVVQVTPAIIRAGLDLHQTRSVSFFEELILTSAHAASCSVLLSEDLNTDEVVQGVRIVNPFSEG